MHVNRRDLFSQHKYKAVLDVFLSDELAMMQMPRFYRLSSCSWSSDNPNEGEGEQGNLCDLITTAPEDDEVDLDGTSLANSPEGVTEAKASAAVGA
ncbi:unnamed protein product [Amoebophrya sp. A120]|nr:unnamed protein product [Amoebophrya sp. A120]|eukprot:GSA120T00013401001.1